MKKEFEVTSDLQASTIQRFLNYIIDLVIIYILFFAIFSIITIIAVFIESESLLNWMQNISDGEVYIIFFAIYIPYYTLTEGFLSKSIAKYITKTKVVMEDGSNPSIGTALKRTLCRIIPFEIFSFLSGKPRGWHDSIPDTYVVNVKDFEEEMKSFYEFDQIGAKEEL